MKDLSFFQEFQRTMVAKGLTLVGIHDIRAPEDVIYHVPCTSARETTLVFHKRGLQFLVIASYHENIGVFNRGYEGYWTINFIVQSQDYGKLLRKIPREEMDKAWSTCHFDEPPKFKFYGYNTKPDFPGFGDFGSSSCEEYRTFKFEGKEEDSLALANKIESAFLQMQPNLEVGRFKDIPLYFFYDSYAFNNNEMHRYGNTKAQQLFLQRFDINYLKRLASFRIPK